MHLPSIIQAWKHSFNSLYGKKAYKRIILLDTNDNLNKCQGRREEKKSRLLENDLCSDALKVMTFNLRIA